jgi:ABC-type Na+ transport system ATPase subunit NatA
MYVQILMYSFEICFEEKNTHLRESISVECRDAVILSRLAIENSLRMIGDVYGIERNTTSIIVRECYETIRI